MKLLRPVFLMLTALVLAACASTTIRSAWFDTTFKGGPMKRIVVVGVGGQVADRRVFEDIFASNCAPPAWTASPRLHGRV